MSVADVRGGASAAEAAYWNGRAGLNWAALQTRIDALFAPLTKAAIAHAAPRPGYAVLDIGCGCGATLLELAPGVLPAGRVTGVDIASVMLEVAARRVREAGLAQQVALLHADAAAHPFPPASFDLAFSRFGVMFFEDPVAAFARVRRALRAGGRLAFACWQRLSASSWFLVPFLAASPHLPAPPPPDPHAPGPFAFADPDRIRSILTDAGFRCIELVPHDSRMRLAAAGDLAGAVDLVTRIGPTARLLVGADAARATAARNAIHDALEAHETEDGVVLGGAIWLVSACAGP